MDLTRRDLLGLGAGAIALKARGHLPGAHSTGKSALPPASLPLVMLDPGHGGKDPGAIGITGLYEKHVAFAAAEQLRGLLLRSGRYRVVLTRKGDSFVRLEDRVSIAQDHNASLFISMHADAVSDPHTRGASVYRLASAASDQQSAALAAHENSVDRLGGPHFTNQPPEVARILASLVQRETEIGSERFQKAAVGALQTDMSMLNNPARHAAFMVLRAADIPSVLVEMGFMSNREDEAALNQPAHRLLIARSMMAAVDRFFDVDTVAAGSRGVG